MHRDSKWILLHGRKSKIKSKVRTSDLPQCVIISRLRSLNVPFFQIAIPKCVIISRSLKVSLSQSGKIDTFRDLNLEIMTHLGISIWKNDTFRDLNLEILTCLGISIQKNDTFRYLNLEIMIC